MADQTPIAVLGCGMVTPFAANTGGRILATADDPRCDPNASYWAIPDAFLDAFVDFRAEIKRDRPSWITGAAITHACADADIKLAGIAPERIALVLGTAFAGQLGMIDFAGEVRAQSPRFVSPIHFPQTVGNYVAGVMSRSFKIHGPNLTIATGASSGLEAVASAGALLSDGAADIALAGGFEVLSDEIVCGLGESTFGESNAAVWSEGACLYVLRRADDTPAGPKRIVIRTRTSVSPDHDRDTHSVVSLVGRSLAAESAMRLCAAANSAQAATGTVVTCAGDGNDVTSIFVQRSA